MKKFILCFCVFFYFFNLNLVAQNKANRFTAGKVGIYSSIGINDVFTLQSLDGAVGYRNDGFFALGINYIQNLNRLFDLEIAIEYSKHNVIYSPSYSGDPFQDMTGKNEMFNILSVPIMTRINVWKYFYFNGGVLFSFDTSKEKNIDTQTGFGGILGLGMKYDFNCGISIYVNPYSKIHTLIPFSPEKYHQRVWENGIRIGLIYDLGK